MRKTVGKVTVAMCLLALLVPGLATAALPQQGGSLDLANPGAGAIRIKGTGGGWTGDSVAFAGDVNGDGAGDIIVGAPLADPDGKGNAGAAYVVFGPFSGTVDLLSFNGFRIDGAESTDFLGGAVAGLGDVNGDGKADVAVGATGAGTPGGTPPGKAFVIFGKAGTGNINTATLGTGGYAVSGSENDSLLGWSVAGVPDMNGDGKAELLVGATQHDANGAESGAAWVIYARGSDVSVGSFGPLDGILLRGPAANAYAGMAVAGAPDMTGDGRGEAIVGAPAALASDGAAYVNFGSNLGGTTDMGTPGFTLTRSGAFQELGQSVSSVDDQNGDAFSDVLVGTRGSVNVDGNRPDAGVAYLAFGRNGTGVFDLASGLNGFQIKGATGERLGYSVAGLGDVNGAGGSDFAVSAPCADPGGRKDAGSTYVIFRSPGRTGVDTVGLPADQGYRVDGPLATPSNCPVSGAAESDMTVAGAGDLTGDGRPDLIVGTPRSGESPDPGTVDGGAYIVLGWGEPAFNFPASASGKVGDPLPAQSAGVTARTGGFSFAIDPAPPAGLTFNTATGVLSGTPTAAVNQGYTVSMTDLAGTVTRPFSLTIAALPVQPCEKPGDLPPCEIIKPPLDYDELDAKVDTFVDGRGRLTKLTVTKISSKKATLVFRCINCAKGSARAKTVTVKPTLTAKKVKKALKRALGLQLNAKTKLLVTLHQKNTVGYWYQRVAGNKEREGCILVNSAKRRSRGKCPTRRPSR